MKFRLHAFEPVSRANGPGLRAVVWFHGCTLGCPGCFNPGTHDPKGGYDSDTEILAAEISTLATRIEGISISGGEPFQQPEALLDMLGRLTDPHLSRLVFTGYSLPEIDRFPLGPAILRHIDVLIAGRYVASRHLGHSLLGSANQQIHLLTDRYMLSQLMGVPCREVILHSDGTMTATGVSPWCSGTPSVVARPLIIRQSS
jgi:anaerobic ribonucleoside-triphosphate reductase activating protein